MSHARAQRGPNAWILAAGALLLVPMTVLFAKSFGNDPRAVPRALEGKTAPVFDLPALDGEGHFSLADHRGQPVVINFWSTWCVPCRQEHPLLKAAPRLHPDVTFVGVLYADEPEKAEHFLARPENTLLYPTVADPGGRVAIDYGVSGVPETYFVNREGQIVYKHAGPLDQDTLRHWVSQL